MRLVVQRWVISDGRHSDVVPHPPADAGFMKSVRRNWNHIWEVAAQPLCRIGHELVELGDGDRGGMYDERVWKSATHPIRAAAPKIDAPDARPEQLQRCRKQANLTLDPLYREDNVRVRARQHFIGPIERVPQGAKVANNTLER